jgi:uncharacterized protein (DUF885 family)
MPVLPRRLLVGLCGALLAAAACGGGAGAGPSAFASFADGYFDSLYTFAPSQGTAAGFHQYDSKIEDFSAASEKGRIATLNGQLAHLDTLRAGKLSTDDSIDAAVIDGAIHSELQDLEVVRSWQTNPMGYAGLAGNAVDLLMKRNFAPPVERLKSVTSRLRGIPAVLTAMRANIENPPKDYYTLGKLEIYKLRADYQKAKGSAYSLRQFHDDFVKQGGLPIKLIRRILLSGDNGPVL